MEKEEESRNIIVERKERMVPLIGGKPRLIYAKLLNPFVDSSEETGEIPLVPLLYETISHKLVNCPSVILFKGWSSPQKNWKQWVDRFAQKYEHTWKKAGIFDAIISSKYKIKIHEKLLLGLTEFWCSETSTFVFPWGEATITLEDLLILHGYSVLGKSVDYPLTDRELVKIEEEMIKMHNTLSRGKCRSTSHWINYFLTNKCELEHIAFLSLWLSKYVFPAHPGEIMRRYVFSVAIHLSQGTRLALAPAILASLYKDLRLLKEQISGFEIPIVWAPFLILQLWAWERFPVLAPNPPNELQSGEPRIARWHKLSSHNNLQVIESILMAPKSFQWRPYSVFVNNWRYPSFYSKKEQNWLFKSIKDDEILSYIRSLRAGELDGIDCVELYQPHRVAMQFGINQHLPAHLSRIHESNSAVWEVWENYDKPIAKNAKFYIPSIDFQPQVTEGYSEWWKQSMIVRKDEIKNVLLQQLQNLKNISSPPFTENEMGRERKRSNVVGREKIKQVTKCLNLVEGIGKEEKRRKTRDWDDYSVHRDYCKMVKSKPGGFHKLESRVLKIERLLGLKPK